MNDAREIVIVCVADVRGCREDEVGDSSRFAENEGDFNYMCNRLTVLSIRELGLSWKVNSQITVGEVIATAVLMDDEAA